MDQKKTAFMGLFAAAAIILGYVESLVPFFAGIPGIKLGLANCPYFLSWRNTPGRKRLLSPLSASWFSDFSSEICSVFFTVSQEAALSLAVMTFMQKKSGFTVMGISVSGGVSHNIGQLAVAALIVENLSILFYAPVLLVSGVITGLLIGFLTQEVLKRARL